MYRFAYLAAAFDRSLGWCVPDEVELDFAFAGTLCEDSSCGVSQPWLDACKTS